MPVIEKTQMPDYQADKMPSLWLFMLGRTWIFALSLFIAIPLWKIFHISMFVTLGAGALLYGTVVGVGIIFLKLPAGYNLMKIYFSRVPVLISCLGVAGISYGFRGDFVIAGVVGIIGFVIWGLFTIVGYRFIISKVRSD
jgi:hypothetical protein